MEVDSKQSAVGNSNQSFIQDSAHRSKNTEVRSKKIEVLLESYYSQENNLVKNQIYLILFASGISGRLYL